MITKQANKRERSKIKIRKKISGTSEKPRMTVFRSNTQIYAQLVDDTTGNVLLSVSSLSKAVAEKIVSVKGKVSKSAIVGSELAALALQKNISTVVFDRNGYRYHGRVKAIADGARKGGLKF